MYCIEVLRVDRNCDQGEIRRRYRELCLRHHPDKRGTTPRGRGGADDDDDDDFEFKEVQHAYSLVGTEEDRCGYDLARNIDSSSSRANVGRRHDQDANDTFFARSTVYFAFVGDGGPSFRFSPAGRYPLHHGRRYRRGGTSGTTTTARRPHYVQEVYVPPDVLRDGGEVELRLKTSPIERYRAAYRGGILWHAMCQGALAVLLTWLRSRRAINWPLSLVLFVTMVHAHVPPPPRRASYPTVVRGGRKGGTEVRYSDGASDVTFVLRGGGGGG
ncbi:hypothetical protein ACHAW5_010803 [Stephanodiscus triporus]|uniref:J domain-containing protein n=1 Tax=Stephanodiscus triporus TaxID=2934178 RepID=A0ABD3NN91_9STRA